MQVYLSSSSAVLKNFYICLFPFQCIDNFMFAGYSTALPLRGWVGLVFKSVCSEWCLQFIVLVIPREVQGNIHIHRSEDLHFFKHIFNFFPSNSIRVLYYVKSAVLFYL